MWTVVCPVETWGLLGDCPTATASNRCVNEATSDLLVTPEGQSQSTTRLVSGLTSLGSGKGTTRCRSVSLGRPGPASDHDKGPELERGGEWPPTARLGLVHGTPVSVR